MREVTGFANRMHQHMHGICSAAADVGREGCGRGFCFVVSVLRRYGPLPAREKRAKDQPRGCTVSCFAGLQGWEAACVRWGCAGRVPCQGRTGHGRGSWTDDKGVHVGLLAVSWSSVGPAGVAGWRSMQESQMSIAATSDVFSWLHAAGVSVLLMLRLVWSMSLWR